MDRNTNRILATIGIVLTVIALTSVAAGAAGIDAGSPSVVASEETEPADENESTDAGDETDSETEEEQEQDPEESGDTDGDTEGETQQDATFEIQSIETNSPIREGETAIVTLEIENTGDRDGTKDVWFKLDRWEKSETEATIAAGERKTVHLEWVSELGDDGDWDLKAATPDDSVIQPYTIRSASESRSSSGSTWTSGGGFEIDDVETNAPINANETLRYTVNVTNTGDQMTQKRVWVELDDDPVNETRVILYPDETETLELSYDTDADEFGLWNTTVYTPDDSEEVPVEIAELKPAYTIESVTMNAPIEAGETLSVSANVTNVGNIAGNGSVWFELENQSIDQTEIDLAINESGTVTLTYNSDSDAVGDWNASVRTEADRYNETVTLVEPSTSSSSDSAEATTQSEQTTTSASESSSSEDSSSASNEGSSTASSEDVPPTANSRFGLGPLGIGAAFVVALTAGVLAIRQLR